MRVECCLVNGDDLLYSSANFLSLYNSFCSRIALSSCYVFFHKGSALKKLYYILQRTLYYIHVKNKNRAVGAFQIYLLFETSQMQFAVYCRIFSKFYAS